jgi:hypothetical protein
VREKRTGFERWEAGSGAKLEGLGARSEGGIRGIRGLK